MKYLIVAALIFPTISQGRTIVVTGKRASALINIGEAIDIADHAMGGRVYVDMKNITCRKVVNEAKAMVNCFIGSTESGQKNDIFLSTENATQGDVANDLRVLLNELTQTEKKTSPTEKQLEVKSVSCDGSGLGHEFDDIDNEVSYACDIQVM